MRTTDFNTASLKLFKAILYAPINVNPEGGGVGQGVGI